MIWQFFITYLPDLVQIILLYVVIYHILKAARGSRFGELLMGIGILIVLLIAFTQLFKFRVLAVIVQWVLIYLAMSSVVIFQPEIRRVLATLGSLLSTDRQKRASIIGHVTTPEELITIIYQLGKQKVGALIALERSISLRGYESSGVELNANVSRELMFSIFTPPMPLHDGGLVIRGGRIASAHCLFPVSSKRDLSVSGMRHRAAVGLSEETDAIVIVVSEEKGCVSVAYNGHLFRYPNINNNSREALLRWVRKAMPVQKTTIEAIADWIRKREVKARKIRRSNRQANNN